MRTVCLGPIVDKLGETATMRVGAIALMVGIATIPLTHNLFWFALSLGIVPIGTTLLFQATSALVTHRAPKQELGQVLGVQQAQTPLDESVRHVLGVAASLLSIAVRNVNLLVDTREVSEHDPLTGCLHRTPGLEKLETELRRAKRSNQPLSVLMLDVDQFKQINDRYGHLCGDLMLGGIGRHLVQTLRGSDIKCRFGGDEFVLVLPDTPLQGAQQVASGIRKAIESQVIEHQGHHVSATVSIGITCAETAEVDVKAIVDRADRALYQAKQSGRNRSCGVPEPGTEVATQPSTTAPKGFVAHDLGLTA